MEAQDTQDKIRHEQERKFAFALIPDNAKDNFPVWGARGLVSTTLADTQERGEWDQKKLLKIIQKKIAHSKNDKLKQSTIYAVIAETYVRDEERFRQALKDMEKVKIEQL